MKEMKSLRDSFINVKICLMSEASNLLNASLNTKIEEIMHLAATLNVLDYHFWNKTIMIGLKQYTAMTIDRKHHFIDIVKWYVDKHMRNIATSGYHLRPFQLEDFIDF